MKSSAESGGEKRGVPPEPAMAARAAVLGTYAPPQMVVVHGEGAWVEDEAGARYLDFTSGIAVNALGHDAPVVREAVERAMARGLIHTSNLFRTRPAEELAAHLVELAFPGQVFFCNSGAEANEAAIKFARKAARLAGGDAKHEIIAFRGAFHGRLYGSLALTDRTAYQEPFAPLMPGVRWARIDDLGSVRQVVSKERTAAIFIEPVQGEGGVIPVSDGFVRDLRQVAHEVGAALVCDEIQSGLGRTGDLFAYQRAGVVPDILTLAKPLAAGLPMGAVVVAPHIAEVMKPGDHGTTFGGGPLVAEVARAVLCAVSDPAFLARVRRSGDRLRRELEGLAARHHLIDEIRGRGLMLGMVLRRPAASEVVRGAREEGLLVVGAGPRVVRLLPPLTVEDDEIGHAVATLRRVLPAVEREA
jgi:predicted acetylornithine/succinylornithine family transaminase